MLTRMTRRGAMKAIAVATTLTASPARALTTPGIVDAAPVAPTPRPRRTVVQQLSGFLHLTDDTGRMFAAELAFAGYDDGAWSIDLNPDGEGCRDGGLFVKPDDRAGWVIPGLLDRVAVAHAAAAARSVDEPPVDAVPVPMGDVSLAIASWTRDEPAGGAFLELTRYSNGSWFGDVNPTGGSSGRMAG